MAKTKEKLNIVNITSRTLDGNVGVTKWEDKDSKTVAFLIPRSKIYDIKFTSPGLGYNSIYFLFGYDEHTDGTKTERVYVGQATEGKDNKAAIRRLIQHDKAKNEIYHGNWEMAVVLTNESTKWTVADLYAIEHAFYNIIPKEILWNQDNPNSGGADYEEYEIKIHDIKRFITAIGYNIFKEDCANDNIQVREELNVSELDQKVVEDLQNGMSKIPEIVTPLRVVRKICDLLPESVWNDQTVFLDPACKGGEFLKEIYERLMKHPDLIEKYPSVAQRSVHILDKQLYGIALSQTSLERTSRALLEYENNLRIIPGYIDWLKRKIDVTKQDGTKKTIKDKLDEEFGKEMNINVIIGNPPYQENISTDDGNKALSKQVFPSFITSMANIGRYTAFITPSRWFTGDAQDKSFVKLRQFFKFNNHIKELHHFYNAQTIFPGTIIKGGGKLFFI